MLRRNFIKALLGSPIALLGGEGERFTAPLSEIVTSERVVTYDAADGSRKEITLPKGKWLAKEIIFTRIEGT